MMVSKILIPDKTIFTHAPTELKDVKIMSKILVSLGLECRFGSENLEINNKGISKDINI